MQKVSQKRKKTQYESRSLALVIYSWFHKKTKTKIKIKEVLEPQMLLKKCTVIPLKFHKKEKFSS